MKHSPKTPRATQSTVGFGLRSRRRARSYPPPHQQDESLRRQAAVHQLFNISTERILHRDPSVFKARQRLTELVGERFAWSAIAWDHAGCLPDDARLQGKALRGDRRLVLRLFPMSLAEDRPVDLARISTKPSTPPTIKQLPGTPRGLALCFGVPRHALHDSDGRELAITVGAVDFLCSTLDFEAHRPTLGVASPSKAAEFCTALEGLLIGRRRAGFKGPSKFVLRAGPARSDDKAAGFVEELGRSLDIPVHHKSQRELTA